MTRLVDIKLGALRTRITVYSSNIIRITHSPPFVEPPKSYVVVREPGEVTCNVREEGKRTTVSTSELEVTVDSENGILEIRWGNGSLREFGRETRRTMALGKETYSVTQKLELVEGEAIFGLGQHAGYSAHTGLNYRNRVVYLAQRNTDIAIPFMVSSRGYGILWDISSMGVFEFRGNSLKVWFESSDAIDFYFIFGPSLDRVIAGYRWLTGDAPMLPRSAFGYWQSKERYASQEEIVSVVKEFRNKGIPIDIIVQDWRYWGKYGWNAFKFDEEYYPDPAKMVKYLHDLGVKLAISIWPMFGEETEIYRKAVELGYNIPETGLVNFFKEEAGKWFWERIKETFFDIGVDAWWLDATEPEIKPLLIYTTWQRELKIDDNRMLKHLNAYPLLETKAVYEGQRRDSNKRVLILTRSGFSGIQRYGVVNWSGDITGDWTTFRSQIWAGLNYCLSGPPYWTTDIGGFFSGNPDTESFRELFIRWFQWGVFCPIFRVHGTYFPKEPWRFGPQAEEILVKYIRLRYRLLPYIYSLAWRVHSEGYTVMRHLAMDFPDDREALEIDDEFMFGPHVLVAPVTTPSTWEREVYLPRGLWYDFWTGKLHCGGRYVTAHSPLDTIPLFVKAGAILPLAPPSVKSAVEKFNEIELRVYPGADGCFTLYDDDGETYDYEKGAYALIPVEWNDCERELIVNEKLGEYRIPELNFNLVIVREGRGVGIEKSEPDLTLNYRGKHIKAKFI